jgi:hypothetical protein
MTASKFKKGRRMEDTGSPLEEIKEDNTEAAKKQQSKNKKRFTEECAVSGRCTDAVMRYLHSKGSFGI